MNSFITNNKRFFSLLLGVLVNSCLHAVTFKNEPLTNFVRTGEALYADCSENCFIILEIEKDNFDMHEGDINNLNNLKEIFEEVMANRSGAISSRTCNMSSNIINYNSSYLIGRECMNIHAKTSLKFTNCLIESPLISITGNEMNFNDCFLINPKVLNIVIDYPESDYDIIQILFHDQPENPTVITGSIDFKNNQTKKTLIISNVKEIRVQFIWDKSLPKNSKPNSELVSDTFSEASTSLVPSHKTLENTAAVNSSSQSRFVPSVVERSLEAVISFFKKNIAFYL